MASAAAVAADEARSPASNDLGEDEGRIGEVTSGIYAKDEELPGVNEASDDDDDDLPSNPLRKRRTNGGTKAREEADDDDEEDLFGDDDEPQPKVRQLDDEDLDSGDDEDRMDRLGDEQDREQEQEQEYVTMDKITMDLDIPRQPNPEPSDGEMYLLKVPDFMTIEPQAWDHTTFQPPTTDHHSKKAPSSTFSPYNTALTTIRWRHSPSNASRFQSNARINRWSNGSLTLQLASDPTVQYEIDANALVPPQRNPIKPTPTSVKTDNKKIGRHGTEPGEKYDSRQDAFTYLLRPHEDSSTLIVTNKITAGLSVKQSANIEDDAIAQLQASVAASNASTTNGMGGFNLIQIDEDPEQAKLQALQAAKEKERRDKRHQAAIDREAAKTSSRLQGRSGGRHLGLNVGMLEDDEMGEGGARPSPNKARAKPRRRRNSEYSEDEDFGRKRFSREDEYDEEDDFLAPSDEEEVVEDDDDPDDGIVEEFEKKGRGSPKRGREAESADDDDEADAPGEEDDAGGEEVQQSRTKRRRVVDDEDEDE